MTYSLNHYQHNALRFAKKDLSHRDALITWTLGFAEAGEFQSLVLDYIDSGYNAVAISALEVRKELGDLMWYCALLSHQHQWALQDVAALSAPIDGTHSLEWYAVALGVAASKVQEPLKKHIGQGHGYSFADVVEHIGRVVQLIWAIANYFGLTLEDVCRANIAKLQDRYPNGFDPAISQARYQ